MSLAKDRVFSDFVNQAPILMDSSDRRPCCQNVLPFGTKMVRAFIAIFVALIVADICASRDSFAVSAVPGLERRTPLDRRGYLLVVENALAIRLVWIRMVSLLGLDKASAHGDRPVENTSGRDDGAKLHVELVRRFT